MKARDYFERMTLDELIEWYNNNMIDHSYIVRTKIMEYSEKGLKEIAEEIGLAELVETVSQGVLKKRFDTCSDFFYYEGGVLYSFNTREEFEEAFLPAMIDEFENQELSYENYE